MGLAWKEVEASAQDRQCVTYASVTLVKQGQSQGQGQSLVTKQV